MKTEASKTDMPIGLKVSKHLTKLGLETPMRQNPTSKKPQNSLTKEDRIAGLQNHFTGVMELMNLDLRDDSLADTPKRIAKMFMDELFWGMDYSNFPKFTTIENKIGNQGIVVERNIQVVSTCEHHLLPIIGFAHVAYLPGKTVPGLSKINRVVEFFSRRPQVQERLTSQIYETLCFLLKTDNVAVTINAEHMCVKNRGVEDPCSDTVTTRIGGIFEHSTARSEYYSMIKV